MIRFGIKQTSTDIPAQDHFTDTSTSETSVKHIWFGLFWVIRPFKTVL